MTVPPGSRRPAFGAPARVGAFEPVVTTDDRTVVGFDVPIHPSGDSTPPHPTPAGRSAEAGWTRRAVVYGAASALLVPTGTALFIADDPASPDGTCPDELAEAVAKGAARYTTIAAISETAALADPVAALAAAAAASRRRERIALDHVGARTGRQALMSLIRPDVIRLDPSLVRTPDRPGAGAAIAAAQAQARRTGAVIVATGIETPSHLAFARSVGAALGQGPLFGPAYPLQPGDIDPAAWLPGPLQPHPFASSFDTVAARMAPSRIGRPAMAEMSRVIEDSGCSADGSALVLVNFQHHRNFGPPTASRYRQLASRAALTAVFGHEMPYAPAPGVHGFPLNLSDPLTGEWAVIIIGDHHATALLGREQTDGTFLAISTDDRELIIAAARPLVQRISSPG